jgi:hypothetical protein
MDEVRVTRLGEFSPIGRLFGFLKITDAGQFFWLPFFRVKSFTLNLTKNGLGFIWGDYFTNLSGRPA